MSLVMDCSLQVEFFITLTCSPLQQDIPPYLIQGNSGFQDLRSCTRNNRSLLFRFADVIFNRENDQMPPWNQFAVLGRIYLHYVRSARIGEWRLLVLLQHLWSVNAVGKARILIASYSDDFVVVKRIMFVIIASVFLERNFPFFRGRKWMST